jgi:hypothetical protein
MICPGTNRPPPIASELERVPAEADGGRGTRGVEYLGPVGAPAPTPLAEPSLAPAGIRGAAEGGRAGAEGRDESRVTPSLMSAASSVAAPSKPPSSVSPTPMGSSPRTVAPVSTSGAVEEPHDGQNRALGETCLPQAEQNMEGRFYQPKRRKTTTCDRAASPVWSSMPAIHLSGSGVHRDRFVPLSVRCLRWIGGRDGSVLVQELQRGLPVGSDLDRYARFAR